mmetsp:Transcript_85491/g.266036  ORF Transcript_85491/g.266036 Transcript_85491/m.266036 type:complete len:88 (-) Transcript_85491:49-312(-)
MSMTAAGRWCLGAEKAVAGHPARKRRAAYRRLQMRELSCGLYQPQSGVGIPWRQPSSPWCASSDSSAVQFQSCFDAWSRGVSCSFQF